MGEGNSEIDPALIRAVQRARAAHLAPFGRLWAKLGFRWIMPFGTLPLPFHPWLARLLPLLIVALVAHAMFAAITELGGGVRWWSLLIAALMLGGLMSVPVVSWVAMAFRVPLLQGLMIGGAMLLVAVDVAAGAEPVWMAIVPAAFVVLFLVQWIGGPVVLRQMQALNAAFDGVRPGTRPVTFEDDRVATSYGNWLFRHCDIACVSASLPGSGRGGAAKITTHFRLTPEDHAAVAGRVKLVRPAGWHVGDGHVAVARALDPGDSPPITVRARPHRVPLWIVTGQRTLLEIDDGTRIRRMIGGNAELVGPVPLFTCFYWLSIFGGQSRWVAGFARTKPVALGTARVYDMLQAAFPALEGSPTVFADAAPLIAELDALDHDQRAAAQALLDCLLSGDSDMPTSRAALLLRPDIAYGHGEALCARLASAKAAKHAGAVRLAAELIARLPDDEFLGLSATLISLLNSKELAFRLLGSDDPSVIDLPEKERSKHVVGGYSLVRHVPQLYERLGDLGQPALPLVMAMGELGRWPAPLARARDRITGTLGEQ